MQATEYAPLDTSMAPGSKTAFAKLGNTVLYRGGDPDVPRKYAMTEGIVVSHGKTKIKVFFPDRPGGKPVPIAPRHLVLLTDKPLVDITTLGVNDPSVIKTWDLDRVLEAIRGIPSYSRRDVGSPHRLARAKDGDREAEAVLASTAIEAIRKAFGIRNRSDAKLPLRAALAAGRVLWVRSDGAHLAQALEPIPFAERKPGESYTHRWVSAYARFQEALPLDEEGFLGRRSGRPPAAAHTEWVILPDDLAGWQAAEKARREKRNASAERERDADRERFEAKHPNALAAVLLLLEQAGIEPVYGIGDGLYYRTYERASGTRSELEISVRGPQVRALSERLAALLALEAGVATRLNAEERARLRARGARELGWPAPEQPAEQPAGQDAPEQEA